MSNICNPVALAEVVGREYIESQLPTRSSYKENKIIDNIRRINENVDNVDGSFARIKELHGKWSPSGNNELISLVRNLFGDDPNFVDTILELENSAVAFNKIVSNINGVVDTSKQLTFAEVSTSLMRGYLRNVKILLPDEIGDNIKDSLVDLPLFTEISESLGSMYYNIALSDNALDMVDKIIGDTIDATGLSTVLSQHNWIRMLPEYAKNFHNNIRLFERLGSRVLPKCTYSKIFHISDKPLAHVYDLARDVSTFFDVLENRKKYLSVLVGAYGDLLRKINNIYPVCHEYSVSNDIETITVGDSLVAVDQLGNKVVKTDNNVDKKGVDTINTLT